MSTKGMSTTAARLLLDRLAPRIDKVLVAHDFDVSGFSIFGTLGSDGRRYRFRNDVHIVDLGLRLSDVEALEAIRAKAEEDAASIALSSDLRRQVVAALRRQPDIPWDLAIANIARKALR